MVKRVIWIILDSVGMGELPDADKFGDVGSNTIGNIAKSVGLHLPNLIGLGLGNIDGMKNLDYSNEPTGCYARAAEISNGKDTTIGHWEMIGISSMQPFPTYPEGFPKEIMDEFIRLTAVDGVLGNCTASGTEIIKQLGEEHIRTGKPIIYTSADSVFQIACHEDVVPVEKLYQMCSIARQILTDEHAVARVIARPFTGNPGNFERTSNRRDFSLLPPEPNLLCEMKEKGLDVIAIGKIEDIFAKQGITEAVHTTDNQDGIIKTLEFMKKENHGLIFTNLVEFDSKWGHRNDAAGYAKGLEEFDQRLPEILNSLGEDDILVINADHGCDPTTPSTDHSREYVPVLLYGHPIRKNVNLNTLSTFADIGQTIAQLFGITPLKIGTGFWENIRM